MKEKLIELYKSDLDEFLEFVSEFYGVENLTNIYLPYKHPSATGSDTVPELSFQMGDTIYSLETIIENIHETYLKLELMKDYDLI